MVHLFFCKKLRKRQVRWVIYIFDLYGRFVKLSVRFFELRDEAGQLRDKHFSFFTTCTVIPFAETALVWVRFDVSAHCLIGQ